MKLELKHLATFLEYRLKVNVAGFRKGSETLVVGLNLGGKVIFGTGGWAWLSQVKPILRSTSQLTDRITHNEKTFIPLIELAKQAYPSLTGWQIGSGTKRQYEAICSKGNIFQYRDGLFSKHGITNQLPNQLPLLEKCREWHFDLDGLIEKGLAVEIKNQ